MGFKTPKTQIPDDPDPRPAAVGDSSAEVQSARREEKKRAAGTYGRQKTILAGNTAADNGNRKTILGG